MQNTKTKHTYKNQHMLKIQLFKGEGDRKDQNTKYK